MAALMITLTIITIIAIFGIRYYLLVRKKASWQVLMLEKEAKDKSVWRITSIVMCIICIALYIGFRWSLAIYNINKYDLFNSAVTEFRSANISIFLMLDLCSLLGVLLPILIIFDWKHKYLLRPVALLALLGGTATVFFTTPDLYSDKWNFQLFLFGSRTIGVSDSDEPLMFLMHYWMITMAIIVLTNDQKITARIYLRTMAFILCYAGYITLCSQLLDLKTHVTATVIGDFVRLSPEYYSQFAIAPGHPSYEIFCEIYGTHDWKWASFDTWITFAVIVTIFVGIKNISYYNLIRLNLIHDNQTKFPFIDFLRKEADKIKSLR